MSNPVKLSKAASLGLHAAVLLASDLAEPMSTKEIASALEVSEAHLSKVLQRLAAAGLVRSFAGPGGGFALAKPRNQITLLEVYETIEGRLFPSKCFFGVPVCAGKGCIFGGQLQEVAAKFRKWLSGTKLSQLTQVLAKEKGGKRDGGAGSVGAKHFRTLSKSVGS